MIKLTYLWPDGAKSDMWLSVEHILWMTQSQTGTTIIALVGDSRVPVAEHPHDIIRMIVATVPEDDEDGEQPYAQ